MHERLRTHAESVAFFGGGSREKEVLVLLSLARNQFLSISHVLKVTYCYY